MSRALEAGVPAKRLRANDLERPFHGVRRVRASEASTINECRSYSVWMHPVAFFCLSTAAQLYSVPLPRGLEPALPLHVGVPAPMRAPKGKRIRGHALSLGPSDRATRHGLRVTSPARTWCDLGAVLTLPELVAAGDHLIHWRLPLVDVAGLERAVAGYPGRRGIGNLNAALALLDDRAESPRESALRVLMIRSGLTGWQSNLVIRLPGVRMTYRGDFVFAAERVIVEYQGGYHDDPAQRAADMTRTSRLAAHGWLVIEVNARDLDDPVELIARIRAALALRRG